ncbi:MAG: hypothetical protein R3F31_23400 [Verrucomicrobiales bacterium]
MLLPLAVVLRRIEDRNKQFDFGGVPKIVQDLFFQNWFFRRLGISVEPNGAPSTCIPYYHFRTTQIESYDYLEGYLKERSPLDSTFCLQLLQCLGEIFVNTRDTLRLCSV